MDLCLLLHYELPPKFSSFNHKHSLTWFLRVMHLGVLSWVVQAQGSPWDCSQAVSQNCSSGKAWLGLLNPLPSSQTCEVGKPRSSLAVGRKFRFLATGLPHVMAAGFPQSDESGKREKGGRERESGNEAGKRKKKRKEGRRGQKHLEQKHLRQKTQSFIT